jgi:hypothetical protein
MLLHEFANSSETLEIELILVGYGKQRRKFAKPLHGTARINNVDKIYKENGNHRMQQFEAMKEAECFGF